MDQLKDNSILRLIDQFQLSPHPEGGWYREVIRSDLTVKRSDGHQRNAITGIIFLLGKDDKSCWHCVDGADEIWIHLQGAPLSLWRLDPNSNELVRLKLDTAQPMQMIPAGFWQAACSQGSYTLVSCCVSPGFDFDDFKMLRDIPKECWPEEALSELI